MVALHELTASALATLICTGEVSSRDAVTAHLERIDAVNADINALTVILRETALQAADSADRMRRSGATLGPLHGVPFTVKENLDCLGSATTHGIAALEHALPYADAPVVQRMKRAGAIPLARGNLSELGLRLSADNPLRGRTQNPWNRKLTAGGSSGGDAAAVATLMTPLGLGTDIGGSLRVPAHFCGVAALKPTTGRIAHAASLPPEDFGMAGQAMLAPGPLARSVADLELCLSVLSGRDPRDPRSVNVPLLGDPIDERRAALITEVPGVTLCDDDLAAIRRAGVCLADAGWLVEEATPPELTRVGELWHKLVATDLSVVMPLLEPVVSPALFAHVMRLCRAAKVHESSNNRLHEERSRSMRAWSGFFGEYPIAIGPNVIDGPWPIDADLDPNTGVERLIDATRFILPGNVLGLPVVALPMGHSRGLPLSIQIYADLWREDLCLEAAAVIERTRKRRAPRSERSSPVEVRNRRGQTG